MVDRNTKKTAEIINPGLGDIEKVRDILFGKYVASFEQRFADLEKRLEADVDQLMNKLVNKINDMDTKVNQSISSLDKRIASENTNRDGEFTNLRKSLSEAETALQHSISVMEDQANQDLVEVRKVLEESQQNLIDQLLSAQKELTAEIDAQKNQLETDKVGRQSLALLLDEVAVKLRSNS